MCMLDEIAAKRGALRVVIAGGFLKSYIEGLLAAAVAFLFVLPGIGAWGVSLFLCVGSIAHIAFTLASGFLVRRMGVRRVMTAAAVLPIVAVCFYVLPSCGVVPLAVGNAIKGSSFGILTAVSPLLIVENTEAERRGRGSAFFQLSMQIGSVVGALFGAGVSALFRERLQLALDIDFMLMLLPVALFLPLARRLPESGAAVRTPAVSFRMTFSRLRVVLPAVGFMMLMSATGVGTVMNYAVVVLNDAGFVGATANLVDTLLRALSIVAVIVAAGVVDRVGRMRLLRASVVIMAVGFAGAAMTSGAAFAVFLLVAVMAFSCGFGACAWAVVPEMLPKDVRAQGTSLALFAGQITTCAVLAGFPHVRALCGSVCVFLLFAAVSAFSFVYFGIIRRKL